MKFVNRKHAADTLAMKRNKILDFFKHGIKPLILVRSVTAYLLHRAGNFKAWTFFSHFQNAGRQDATRESITGDDSLTEYCL